MITAIRDVRRAKNMTLAEVAAACNPPTTAQTIGRLETGTRTVSVAWLNRIARALGVEAADLVKTPERSDISVAALIGPDGAQAPRRELLSVPPRPEPEMVAVVVQGSIGEYRTGDEIWCERLSPDALGGAVNRDVLIPRPGGRFLFGRLLAREAGKLHLLPLGAGARQQVVTDPPWAAVATRLLRNL